MSAAQRVSRGFHRLAVFLAAIPLLIGVLFSLGTPYNVVTSELASHQAVLCANKVYQTDRDRFWKIVFAPIAPGHAVDTLLTGRPTVGLRELGCSQNDNFILVEDAKNPPEFSWWRRFGEEAGSGLAFAVIASLAIYGLVRAIGWVIGGFAAS
jgi:hypothetical protein